MPDCEKEETLDSFDRSNYLDFSDFIQYNEEANNRVTMPTILPFEVLSNKEFQKLYPRNLEYLCFKFPIMSNFLELLADHEKKVASSIGLYDRKDDRYHKLRGKQESQRIDIVSNLKKLSLFGIEHFKGYINVCVEKQEDDTRNRSIFDTTESLFSHLLSIPHLEIEATWSQYCSLISEKYPNNYKEQVKQIKNLKTAYDKNKMFVDECVIIHETKLSKNKRDTEIWLSYLWNCRDFYLKETNKGWRLTKLKVILALFYRALFELYYKGLKQFAQSEASMIVRFHIDFLKLLMDIYIKLNESKSKAYYDDEEDDKNKEIDLLVAYIIRISNLMVSSHETILDGWLFYLNYTARLKPNSCVNVPLIPFNPIRIHLKNLLNSVMRNKNQVPNLDDIISLATSLLNFEYIMVKEQQKQDNQNSLEHNSFEDSDKNNEDSQTPSLDIKQTANEEIPIKDPNILEYLYQDKDWLLATNADFCFNSDTQFRLIRSLIDIFVDIQDFNEARELYQSLIANTRNKSLLVWLTAINAEKKIKSFHWDNTSEVNENISSLYSQAFKHIEMVEWPELLLRDWLNHEFLYGSDSFEALKRKIYAEKHVNEVLKVKEGETCETKQDKSNDISTFTDKHADIRISLVNNRKRVNDDDDIYKIEKGQEENDDSKDKAFIRGQNGFGTAKVNNTKKIKRDRENLSVRILDLPNNITETEIQHFFQDCGNSLNLKIFSGNNHSKFAIMEFSKKEEFLSALTKTFKKIRPDAGPIVVEKNENTTVYVSNFSSLETEKSLSAIFKQAGTIRSIRFPSLKYNADRRFCYIEYSTCSEALSAINKFHNNVIGSSDYKLQVRLSDPEKRQARSMTALETKRELFINNLDFTKVDESMLQVLFAKFGEVQRIHIPLSIKGRNIGRSNDGYAFVTFQDADSAALAVEKLNMVNFQGRIIEVSVAVSKKSNHHVKKVIENMKDIKEFSSSDISERSVSILGLPDTINASQLMDLLNRKIGKVNKLDLRTLNGTALVEFQTLDSSGKAGLLLNGQEINGKIVTVSNRNDFFKLQQQQNTYSNAKHQNLSENGNDVDRASKTLKSFKNNMFIPSSVRRRRKQMVDLNK